MSKEEKYILTMLAETYIHPGSGQSTSHVDLPVSRELTTDYPFISSTSLKGAIRANKRKTLPENELDQIFGKGDSMGAVTFSDARLLLLPVRSLEKLYYWITCPYILERLKRDLNRIGKPEQIPKIEKLPATTSGGMIHLEEREFESEKDTNIEQLVKFLEKFIPNEDVKKRLHKQLVVLSDEDFKWYANFGLPILARNVLNENKTSENVWYEEYLPTDTVMYSLIYSRTKFRHPTYLQIGANETVGQGWFYIKQLEG